MIKLLHKQLIKTAALLIIANPLAFSDEPYDRLLLNGTVVDGTGVARYRADIAIKDGRIAAIGELDDASANERIDVEGLIVAPGFIDTHSHADGALGNPETAAIEGFLKQGVTTAVYGVDGHIGLEQIREYAGMGKNRGMGCNFMTYIGHNVVRREVLGMENRAPDADEMATMKAIVKDAMEFGAAGLSTGLMYLPGGFAKSEEIIELAKVTAPYGGRYDSHVRDPARNLIASHRECLDIAYAAGVDAHPGHVKAVGGMNFGKGPEFVKLIESGIKRGQNVTVDLYPYDGAAALPIIAILSPADDMQGEALAKRMNAMVTGEGDPVPLAKLMADLQQYWQFVADKEDLLTQAEFNTANPPEGVFSWVKAVGYQSMRIVVSSHPGFEGRMVTDLATELGITPFELYRQVIAKEGSEAMVTLGAIQEEDIRVIMKQPWAMISSDGMEVDVQHPRDRGTFPRLLGRYVRDWKVLTLEEAVYKITGLPAQYLKQQDRGVIREGAIADITVFDPDTIIDKSTWAEPDAYAEGVEHVLIDGEFALRNGNVSKQRYGKFIPFQADSNSAAGGDHAAGTASPINGDRLTGTEG